MSCFSPDDTLKISDIKWQIYAYLGFPQDLKGKEFDKAAREIYGLDFGLDERYSVAMETGSYNPETYMELISYNFSVNNSGQKAVSLVFNEYNYQDGYDNSADFPGLSEAISNSRQSAGAFIMNAISDGSISTYGKPSLMYKISYYSDNGYTPKQFFSCESFKQDDSGQWVSCNQNGVISDASEDNLLAAFEKWLIDRDDILDFKVSNCRATTYGKNSELISGTLWLELKVEESAKAEWIARGGRTAENDSITLSNYGIYCIKDDNGGYVFDPDADYNNSPIIKEYMAYKAFVQYITRKNELTDYSINSIKVSDNSDNAQGDKALMLVIQYNVKPKDVKYDN